MHSYRQAYTLELLSQESCIYGWRCHAHIADVEWRDVFCI